MNRPCSKHCKSMYKIWTEKDISKSTKVLLYQTLVQSIILYNSDTEGRRQTEAEQKLRKICGITRRDRRRNLDILKELSIVKDIVEVLQILRLTYFGHVTRTENDRFPHILLHGYTHGYHPRERPKKK